MNRRKWKKAVGICLVIAALVLAFWYGGDAPGLQGFSIDVEEPQTGSIVDDGAGVENTAAELVVSDDDTVSKKEAVTSSDGTGTGSDKGSKKKVNIFQRIVMQVKKISSSKSAKNKNTQTNKKAQKNANRAAEQGEKKNKALQADKNAVKSEDAGNEQDKDANETVAQSKSAQGNNTPGKESGNNSKTTANARKNSTDSAKKTSQPNRNTGDSVTTAENNGDVDNSTASTEDTGNADAQAVDSVAENGEEIDDSDAVLCTIYISCAAVLNHLDLLTDATKKVIPDNGVILDTTSVKVKKDSTVFDVLEKAAKVNQVHLEFNYTPAYKTYYIEGIGNLYQFDAGNLSGWMYSVNGEFPGVGCSGYKVKDGDSIMWLYTCSFGKDVGGYFDESGE